MHDTLMLIMVTTITLFTFILYSLQYLNATYANSSFDCSSFFLNFSQVRPWHFLCTICFDIIQYRTVSLFKRIFNGIRLMIEGNWSFDLHSIKWEFKISSFKTFRKKSAFLWCTIIVTFVEMHRAIQVRLF